MFLNKLKKEEQKLLFLDLAIKAAECSCGISEEERKMIQVFAKEMEIPVKLKSDNSVDQVTSALISISTPKELRIMMFEIIGIMYSDSCYDSKEQNFVTNVSCKFGIDDSIVKDMELLVKKYSELYSSICEVVMGMPGILTKEPDY